MVKFRDKLLPFCYLLVSNKSPSFYLQLVEILFKLVGSLFQVLFLACSRALTAMDNSLSHQGGRVVLGFSLVLGILCSQMSLRMSVNPSETLSMDECSTIFSVSVHSLFKLSQSALSSRHFLFAAGGRTGLMVRASDSGSGDPGSILGRVGVFVSLSKRHLLPKSTGNTQE